MQTRLTELLVMARPRRALFFTFTLSVSWFESFCLPLLTKVGCERIDLVVDSRGVHRSTAEAVGLYAGNVYRVIPIAMGSGFFHPKVVYLETEDDDVLVVGSGNLTFAGQGKNLEVIDSLNASDHPGVFSEFATFLDLFMTRDGLSEESVSVLRSYAELARGAVSRSDPEDEQSRSAWLIHTLQEPALPQLARLVSTQLAEPKILTVMSPYHSPDGSPIVNLLEKCGTQKLRIGISNETPLIAPFSSENNLPEGATFVIPETERSDRFAHAKCFEVLSKKAALVMTGSVNATSQSLESKKNIEISLVRKLMHSPFVWTEVEPEGFVECDFDPGELAKRFSSLDAQWCKNATLSGVLSPAVGECSVRCEIWSREVCIKVVEPVAIDAKGKFQFPFTLATYDSGALRLRLVSSNLDIFGWINVELELDYTSHERELARAAAGIMGGNYEHTDLRAIYTWMANVLKSGKDEKVLRTPPQSQRKPKIAGVQPSKSARSYDEWFEDESSDLHGASADIAKRSLAAAFLSLNRDLDVTGNRKGQDDPVKRGKRGRRKLLSKDEEAGKASDAVNDKLAKEDAAREAMLQKLPDVLAQDATDPLVSGVVALSASAALKRACHISVMHQELQQKEAQELGLGAWLSRYARFDYSERNRERLIPTFCAIACCAAYLGETTELSLLKDAVSRQAGRDLIVADWAELARSALEREAFSRIPESEHNAVVSYAQAIAHAVTAAQHLEELIGTVLGKISCSRERSEENARRYPGIIFALKWKGFDLVDILPNEKSSRRGCPACNSVMHLDEIRQLRTNRAVVHASCGRALFYGLDRARLARYGVV